MPPIQPPRPPGPPARGGRAIAPKAPRAPKAPAVRVKPIDPNARAQQNAMSAFRTALAQLQSSTPAVDANAIRAPYAASQAVTGQLGQGLQQSVLNSGQAAQAQYGQALGQAQQQAAAFGVSSGAGANQSALQNTGAAPLAQQTNAYAAAAPQAAAQWQQLLERTAAAKVSDAQLQRAQGLTSAEQSLSAQIPTAIGNEQDRLFRAKTQRENIGLARTQLTQKQNEAYNRDVLGQQRITSSANTAAANRSAANQRSANSIAATNQRSQASIDAANQRQSKQLQASQKKATASGIKGISQANALLKPSAASKGTKPVIGHTVTYPTDPNGVNAGAPPLSAYVPAGQQPKPPPGFLAPLNEGKPVLGQAKAGATGGTSLAAWNRALAILQKSNPGVPVGQLMPIIGKKPKK